jgi:hypothetical protein
MNLLEWSVEDLLSKVHRLPGKPRAVGKLVTVAAAIDIQTGAPRSSLPNDSNEIQAPAFGDAVRSEPNLLETSGSKASVNRALERTNRDRKPPQTGRSTGLQAR